MANVLSQMEVNVEMMGTQHLKMQTSESVFSQLVTFQIENKKAPEP